MVALRSDDRRGPPVDFSQPSGSTAPSARENRVDVSRAKLSRSSLLQRVGPYGDQHSEPRGPCSCG
jgi:hypothetical protein